MSKTSFKKLMDKLDIIDKDVAKLKTDFFSVSKKIKAFKKDLAKEMINIDKKEATKKPKKKKEDAVIFNEPILINLTDEVKKLFNITQNEISFSNFNKKVNKYLVDNNLIDRENKLIKLNDDLLIVLKFTRRNTKSKLNYNTVHNFLKHNYTIKKDTET